jgi:hypothetical protein
MAFGASLGPFFDSLPYIGVSNAETHPHGRSSRLLYKVQRGAFLNPVSGISFRPRHNNWNAPDEV